MKNTKINVLGTEYTINEATENEDPKLTGKDGYCDSSTKTCVIDRLEDTDIDSKGTIEDYKNSVKRHELIHAFLYESGLDSCSWADNEELVDWLAIQWHKINAIFDQLGI